MDNDPAHLLVFVMIKCRLYPELMPAKRYDWEAIKSASIYNTQYLTIADKFLQVCTNPTSVVTISGSQPTIIYDEMASIMSWIIKLIKNILCL
jgi:hypothetical protein